MLSLDNLYHNLFSDLVLEHPDKLYRDFSIWTVLHWIWLISRRKQYLFLEFLEGRAQPEDIHICLNREGRPSGEAYVGFHTDEDYANSKQKHKQNMGSRYIEVYDR